MRFLLAVILVTSACATPLPVERTGFMLAHLTARDPAPVRLLRPRFGLPAIVRSGAPFDVELQLEAGRPTPRAALAKSGLADDDARRCLAGEPRDECVPLSLLGTGTRLQASSAAAPEAGGWDLVIEDGKGGIERARRAVWLRADDPAALAELRVAHLSDLHVGKRASIPAKLVQVVKELNALGPDLVIVTGDVAENGDRTGLFDRAAATLAHLEAPLVVVPGNHDHGFGHGAFSGRTPGSGWTSFARAFHPWLFFEVPLGRWRFVGFDSGASVFSPFVLTRGLLDSTVDAIRALLDGAPDGGGVVLMSHAPTRARITGHRASSARGPFGHMMYGARKLEAAMRATARAGKRVLHLSGHTHWSDVFESDGSADFTRWDHKVLLAGDHEVAGHAALVSVQSATHSTFPTFDNGRGCGYMWLTLRDGPAHVELKKLAQLQ